MRISIFHGVHDLSAALARDLVDRLHRTPALILGLPTGRTPLHFYRCLVTLSTEGHADFSRATTFNLDEFLGVAPEQAGSYQQYMERHFFRHINIDRRQIHFLNGAAPSADAECARYEADIAAAGGIDLQVLGIGANGHIGFNEPGEHLAARTHRVILRPETRRANAAPFGGDPNNVPTEALSMGMATILQARSIALMATGAEKAECVAEMTRGPLTTRLPASFLQLHPDVHVMLDEAAARRIR